MALKKTHAQFRAALRQWDEFDGPAVPSEDDGDRLHRSRRVTFALWWFIENVRVDDPARNEIFFILREMVRAQP